MALVLVLAFLVLISALVVAFFTSVQTELQGAKNYASAVTVKQLAETTTHIVMGQIIDGTQSFVTPGNVNSQRLTWASQPGLIRTYADDGSPGRTFKLYSTANMVEDAGTDYIPANQLANEVPATWPAAPALFTDLNKPVLVADPQGSIHVRSNLYTANYPIVDPMALLNAAVEGFSIQSAPGFSTPTWTPDPAYDPVASPSPQFSANPAPMPVRWIYILKDGTITVPDAGGSTVAAWTLASANLKPSKQNPIVGRVAFWTDDETCKLNINTASEGVFWDRAWANSSLSGSPYGEAQLNTSVPVRGEFNRYPGHPAMTCLSPVFGGLISAMNVPLSDNLSTTDYTTYYKPYYDLCPRVVSGGVNGSVTYGSMGGTVTNYQATAGALSPDANRLYASLDELLFRAAGWDDACRGVRRIAPRGEFKYHQGCPGESQVLFNSIQSSAGGQCVWASAHLPLAAPADERSQRDPPSQCAGRTHCVLLDDQQEPLLLPTLQHLPAGDQQQRQI